MIRLMGICFISIRRLQLVLLNSIAMATATDGVKLVLTLNSLADVKEFKDSDFPSPWPIGNRPRSVMVVIGDEMIESERVASKELLSRNFDLIVYDKRSDEFSITDLIYPSDFGTSGFGTTSGVGSTSSVVVRCRASPMKVVVGLVGYGLYYNDYVTGYIATGKAGWWLIKSAYCGNKKYHGWNASGILLLTDMYLFIFFSLDNNFDVLLILFSLENNFDDGLVGD
ncbi:hypothetical protein ABFS83_03G045100 [Erythranthe nasuta]